jgi:hypothetical protein
MSRQRHGIGELGLVTGLVSGVFLLICAAVIAAGFRQNVLVEHVVLPVAPLGQVAAALALLMAWKSSRALFTGAILFVIACVTLSILFTSGAVKTNIDLVARFISAEARGSDLIVLVPGAPGASFNWYFKAGNSQIDYPVVGPLATYEFDHGFARIADTTALRRATDSVLSAHRSQRRVWFVSPANWDLRGGDSIVVLTDSIGVRAASRQRAAFLHQRLLGAFGAPALEVRTEPAPWSMEVMLLERFGS